MQRWSVTLIIAGCLACIGQAQYPKPSFNHLSMDEGLSQSINSFVFHDTFGYVWISSIDGLNRFDGQQVKVYRPDPEGPSNMLGKNIQSPFFTDANYNLWFTTVVGINQYHRDRDLIDSYVISDSSGQAIRTGYYCFDLDSNGQLLVSVQDHLYTFDTRTKQQKSLGSFEGKRALRSAVHPREIWTFHKGMEPGLFRYVLTDDHRIEQTHNYFIAGQANTLNIQHVYETTSGHLWLACNEGLYFFDPVREILSKIDHSSFSSTVVFRYIIPWKNDYLWVSSNNGLYIIHEESQEVMQHFTKEVDDPLSLSSNDLFELYLDHQENLWVSVWGKGLDYTCLKKNRFHHLKLTIPGSSQIFDPGSMVQDRQGNIWCGSRRHDLMLLGPDRRPLPEFNNRNIRVKQIVMDAKGHIWILSWSDNKVYIFPSGKKEPFIFALPHHSSNTLEKWYDDQMVVTYYDRAGISVLSFNGKNFHHEEQFIISPDKSWNSVYLANNGEAYLCDKDLVTIRARREGKHFVTLDTLDLGGPFKQIRELPDSSIWINGEFGLVKYLPQNKSSKKYTEQDGLSSRYIYCLLYDEKNDNIWVSSNAGISRMNRPSKAIHNFTLKDGLQALEYNSNACLKDADGNFWFGGINGYTIFYPDSIRLLQHQARVNISDIRLNGKSRRDSTSISQLPDLTIHFKQNSVGFSFVASDYADPDRTRLKYQMIRKNGRPYDADWIETKVGKVEVSYPQMPYGDYVLKIKAANSDGIWNQNNKKFDLVILPPFYQTTLFKVFAIISLLALTYGIVIFVVRQKTKFQDLKIREQALELEKQRTLEAERKRVAGEMHDDLGGVLTSIGALTERLISRNTKEESLEVLAKIKSFSNEAIEGMRSIIWAMDSKHDDLPGLLIHIRRFMVEKLDAHQIDCNIQLPNPIPDRSVNGPVRRNVFLCVKECVHNIIRHSGATKVQTSITVGTHLTIRIQDNGKGKTKTSAQHLGTGNGMDNMQSRLENVNGVMKIDKSDGWTVHLKIPLTDN